MTDRSVCAAPDCTCARNPDATCREILRLRAEVERLRRLIGEAYVQRARPAQALRELFGASRAAGASDEDGAS